MAIDPGLADLGELAEVVDGAAGCAPDADQASAEYGEEWLNACAMGLADEARWLVDNYPALPARHAHHR